MTRKLSALAMAAWVVRPGTVQAAQPQQGPTPVEVKVELGTKGDALRFVPDHLSFDRGVYYRLAIHTPARSRTTSRRKRSPPTHSRARSR
jgi:hypothetical protein